MGRLLFIAFTAGISALCAGETDDGQGGFELTEDSVLKVDHRDSIPSVIKKAETAPKKKNAAKGPFVLKNGAVFLICYRNGICQVKDVRTLITCPGINEVVIDGLYPGLAEESLSFRTPKKGKISVVSYSFDKRDLSPEALLLSSVGDEVFFQPEGGSRREKGKLLSIEKENSIAVIESDGKCFLVPVARCGAVGMKALDRNSTNSLRLLFESPDANESEIEINYLTKNISWKHICIADIFEKLDRIDISSEALLKNDTDFDLKNMNVTFDPFSPTFSESDCGNDRLQFPKNSNVGDCTRNLSVKRRSHVMCMLKSVKEQKPGSEYMVKIPGEFPVGEAPKEIPVLKLLVVENAAAAGIDIDVRNSELFIFRRVNNEPRFWGKYALSSFVKDGNLVFEIGTTDDLSAQMRQTDSRKISDGQREYGLKVVIKNNRNVESDVTLITDANSACRIVKKEFEPSDRSKSSTRKLRLRPNGSEELHLKIRTGG